MATVEPGHGRYLPDKGGPGQNYSQFLDWFSHKEDGTVSWARRTANRPVHMRPGTLPDIKRQRMLFGNCSKKWKNLSIAQKNVWKTICVKVIRHKHKGSTQSWTVKGRNAFMSSCLLGFIRPCDRMDNPPDLPPDTIINILMFHFRLVDINRNPINRAAVEIRSRSLKEKDGTDKVMYNQETDVDGYPPDFGVPGNFQPYDISAGKIYESQKKTVNVAADMTVDIVMC